MQKGFADKMLGIMKQYDVSPSQINVEITETAMMASFAFFIKPILTPFVTFVVNGIVPGVKVFVALAFIVCGSYISTYKKKA